MSLRYICIRRYIFVDHYYKKKILRDQMIIYLKETITNKETIQTIRDLNFHKELQVKYEINRLKKKKDE